MLQANIKYVDDSLNSGDNFRISGGNFQQKQISTTWNGPYYSTFVIERRGNVVTLQNSDTGKFTQSGTSDERLPIYARPARDIDVCIRDSSTNYTGALWIMQTGQVKWFKPSTALVGFFAGSAYTTNNPWGTAGNWVNI